MLCQMLLSAGPALKAVLCGSSYGHLVAIDGSDGGAHTVYTHATLCKEAFFFQARQLCDRYILLHIHCQPVHLPSKST